METDLRALGLDSLLADAALYRDKAGAVFDAAGHRAVCATPEFLSGLRYVLERERSGAWRQTGKAAGAGAGQVLAQTLDRQLASLGKPALAAQPLDACLALLARAFATHGWGRLSLDLTHAAEHGLVVATLDHSCVAAALPAANDLTDAFAAGTLQAFFEHISGQHVGCEEIACRSAGAAQCVFVITTEERLSAVLPLIGREAPATVIARLTR